MNIMNYEYILSLAKCGNMTQAAKELYISQSNLSQFLSHEEKVLGKKLFQRIGGKYVPTPAGEIYIAYAEKMVSLNRQFREDLARLSKPNVLRIGTTSMTAVHMLENVLPKFRKTHSEINTSIVDCSNLENAIYALENDNVDAAFVTAYSETLFPGNAEVMAREEIVLGVPSALPFCKRYSTEAFSTVTMQEVINHLSRVPFIIQYKGTCIRHLLDDLFRNYQFKPGMAFDAGDADSIVNMIDSGLGLGFVPINRTKFTPKINYFSLDPKMFRLHMVYFQNRSIDVSVIRDLINLAVHYYQAQHAPDSALPQP
jgi:LysR family transcriptional activator of glutamate synthase operon